MAGAAGFELFLSCQQNIQDEDNEKVMLNINQERLYSQVFSSIDGVIIIL